ncbi:MAG: DUF192 domain-containing protein [Negativicutes bacterium]|nr:DUF192 domain-containing protein [Negativicutes bacterium]
MTIRNLSRNTVIASTARVAATFGQRLKGLLGTRELPRGEALIIRPCRSVHTFGMNYPIDVIFAGADNKIIKTVSDLGPGRIAACFAGSYVIELPAGTLAATCTQAGDQIAVSRTIDY